MRTRVHRLAVPIVLLSAAQLSCEARLADSEEPIRQQWCTGVNAASVLDESGDPIRSVIDQEGNFTWMCWCLTLEEGIAKRPEVNDLAYEVCLDNAAAMGYPEANDCAYWHSIGHWGDPMFRVWSIHENVVCDEEQPTGCGVE